MGNQKICIIFKCVNNEECCKEIYFSKNTIVNNTLIQYLKITNSKIELSPKKIVFMYYNILLNHEKNLNKRLSDLHFKNDKNIVRVLNCDITGGGGDFIEFCNVSKRKKELIKSNNIGIPDKGINIYGFCVNYGCIAYNQEVVVHINENYFDLLSEKHDLKCPICKNIIIPNTVGFLQCKYKIKGKKLEEHLEDFNFIEIADKPGKIEYYNWKENKNGKTKMVQLCIEIIQYI